MDNFNLPVDETITTFDVKPFNYTSHFHSFKKKKQNN